MINVIVNDQKEVLVQHIPIGNVFSLHGVNYLRVREGNPYIVTEVNYDFTVPVLKLSSAMITRARGTEVAIDLGEAKDLTVTP